jgi:hypothetical protein
MRLFRGGAWALLLVCPAGSCFAQHWAFGAVGGYSYSPSLTASNSLGEAKTGLKAGATAGAVVSQDLYNHLSGELRYLYRFGDMKASGQGRGFTFSGLSHAVHYDILIHSAPRNAAVRPFIAVGGGVRIFRGTGQESASQPLDQFVVLTRTRETKPLFTPGVGVEFRKGDRFSFTLEFRDYITPVPNQIMLPVPGTKLTGWMHDFTPLFGLKVRL